MPLLRLIFVFFALLCLASCASIAEPLNKLLDSAPKPSAFVKNGRVSNLTADALTLTLDVEVENPYAVALPLTAMDYAFSFSGQRNVAPLLKGMMDSPGSIPAKDSKVLQVPVQVGYQELLNAVKGLKPGMVAVYKADLNLLADMPPRREPLRLPISYRGEVPVPAPPEVSAQAIEWDKLSLNNAAGLLKLNIRNPNEFDVTFSNMEYNFTLGGQSILNGKIAEALELASNKEEPVEIPFSIRAMDLGLAAFSMLRKGESDYSISGDVDIQTPFGNLSKSYLNSGAVTMKR